MPFMAIGVLGITSLLLSCPEIFCRGCASGQRHEMQFRAMHPEPQAHRRALEPANGVPQAKPVPPPPPPSPPPARARVKTPPRHSVIRTVDYRNLARTLPPAVNASKLGPDAPHVVSENLEYFGPGHAFPDFV